MSMIYDITRTVSSNLKGWAGETPFSAVRELRLEDGHSVNLTILTLSAHTGTHMDAYYHFEPDGAHPVGMPLEAYIGTCYVVTVNKRQGALTPADFAHVDLSGVKRLLIHSHISDLPDDVWTEEFPYLSVELIDWLHDLGVILIGLDSPSVDSFDSKDLSCHHALFQRGIVNLESLYLRDVPDGYYELIALPLKLDEVCGSPVRAILRQQEG
ncbi:MAG: arylformamidase [Chloroflexi bacterium]|nr:MAG: arylformamidase [Chloroflexota bacterium]